MNTDQTPIDDGGPAFPVTSKDGATAGPTGLAIGMSLRDYYAAKVMQGILANPGGPLGSRSDTGFGWINGGDRHIVSMAFGIADDMIAARSA